METYSRIEAPVARKQPHWFDVPVEPLANQKRDNHLAPKGANFATPARLSFRGPFTSLRMTPEGLELAYPRTTYLITRWPELAITYHACGQLPRHLPKVFRTVVFSALDDARLGRNLAHRLVVSDLLAGLPLGAYTRLVSMRSQFWNGIEALATLPQLMDLLQVAPAIFAAVAQYMDAGVITPTHHAALLTCSRGKQRDILKWMGLGSTEAHCKILRKLNAYDFSYAQWRVLARNLRRAEVCEVLQHVEVIPTTVHDHLTTWDGAKVLTAKALAESIKYTLDCVRPSPQPQAGYIDEVLSIGELFRRFGIMRSSVSSFRQFLQLLKNQDMLIDDLPFAEGPRLDLPGIQPIKTPRDLKAEGTLMQHCVGSSSYVLAGLAGRYCFFRLYHPSRATLGLERSSTAGGWRLDQLQGPRNSKVPNSLRAKIEDVIAAALTGNA